MIQKLIKDSWDVVCSLIFLGNINIYISLLLLIIHHIQTNLLYRFFRKPDGTWDAEKVISVPNKQVEGYVDPEISGTEYLKCNILKNLS